MGGACSTCGDGRGAYRVLVEKPEGRKPLGSLRSSQEDNIKMDLREVEWGRGWIDVAQDRDRWLAVVNAVMNPTIP
jgi:hypothetical protein